MVGPHRRLPSLIIPEHLFYVKGDFLSCLFVYKALPPLKISHLIVYTSSLLYHFS